MSNTWPDLKGAASGAMSSRTGSDEEKLSKLKAEAKTHGFDKGHRDVSLEYEALACLVWLAMFGLPLWRPCLVWLALFGLPCLACHCGGPAFLCMQVLTAAPPPSPLTHRYFAKRPIAVMASLNRGHVLALRLFSSTAVSRRVNRALHEGCSAERPHPYPSLVTQLIDALHRYVDGTDEAMIAS